MPLCTSFNWLKSRNCHLNADGRWHHVNSAKRKSDLNNIDASLCVFCVVSWLCLMVTCWALEHFVSCVPNEALVHISIRVVYVLYILKILELWIVVVYSSFAILTTSWFGLCNALISSLGKWEENKKSTLFTLRSDAIALYMTVYCHWRTEMWIDVLGGCRRVCSVPAIDASSYEIELINSSSLVCYRLRKIAHARRLWKHTVIHRDTATGHRHTYLTSQSMAGSSLWCLCRSVLSIRDINNGYCPRSQHTHTQARQIHDIIIYCSSTESLACMCFFLHFIHSVFIWIYE